MQRTPALARGAGLVVAPPPPDVIGVPGTRGAAGAAAFSGAGLVVAPPPPDVIGVPGTPAPAARAAALSGTGLVVAPPPADEIGVPGAPAPAGRADALSASGLVVAPPPPDEIGVPGAPDGAAPAAAASAAPEPSAPPPAETDAPRPEDRRKEAEYDERWALAPLADAEHLARLGIPEIFGIIRHAVVADSGDEGHAAVLTDEAYAGDPAFAGRRFGLQWGLALFPQSSGLIGEVLRLTQSRGAQAFDEMFGPDSLALVRVTGAADPALRMDPVGEPLSSPAWIRRFRDAAQNEACRAAQNEVAVERLFRPMLRAALAMGLDTPRGLAMAFDRVAVRGLGGGVRWLLDAAGLLAAPDEVARALAALGHADLRAFQLSTDGLAATGEATAETRVALLEAVRRAGAIALPSGHQVQARLLAAATGSARRRLGRLKSLPALSDEPVR